jgi:hypothetical protein
MEASASYNISALPERTARVFVPECSAILG